MLHFACLGLSFLSALMLAPPAVAQAEEADNWALSGGFDLLELRAGQGDSLFLFDGSFSYGNSRHQLMLAMEGGGALNSQIDEVQARFFYGYSIGNTVLMAGARKDFKPHPGDLHAAIGIQGMIGTRLNWESYAFLSDDGGLIGEAQIVYQLPVTGRLYLEPRIGAGWSARDVVADAVQAGLTEGEGTLRLRYRLTDKINIYTAVVHERLLGGTRRLAREQGEARQSTMAVFGFGFSL